MTDDIRLKSISFMNMDDGIHVCPNCHVQVGEGEDHCLNCALYESEQQIETLQMSEDYYKTGARQTGNKRAERPRYVPKRISIHRTVRSDMPGPSIAVHPGEYDAHVNQYGAVSIKITDDSFLGIMLYEFEVIEWQKNPCYEDRSEEI